MASGAVFVVDEMEHAVVTRFGEIQYGVVSGFHSENKENEDPQIKLLKDTYEHTDETFSSQYKTGAGLYFKLPFVDQVHKFDSRLLHWNGGVHNISTMDLRTLRINTGAFWRILDPIEFYETLGHERQALARMGGVVNSQVEDMISNTRLIEAVRNKNLNLEERVKKRLEVAEEEQEDVKAAKIRYGRSELIEKIMKQTKPELIKRFGIELKKIVFTQLNYTDSVRENVYDRMIAERQRIAQRYRAQGEQRKREILGEVSRREDEILSNADRQVKEILGEAEGERIQIHAEAFRQNPKFYRFHRALETYKKSMGNQSIFLLTDENRLLEYTTSDEFPTLPDDSSSSDD